MNPKWITGFAACSVLANLVLATSVPVQSKQTIQIKSVVRIHFPSALPERASVTYGLHHPTGASSNHFDVKMRAGASYFEIPIITANGIPVDRLRAVVWVPGCKMQLFDEVDLPVDLELQFKCERQKTLTFNGRVNSGGPGVLSVNFMGVGICFWMEVWDGPAGLSCGGPQIKEVATADVAADGTFTIELPDFSAENIASQDSLAGFEFCLSRSDQSVLLRPESPLLESSNHHLLRILARYPGEVSFLPEFR
jgi:hypothetical protein